MTASYPRRQQLRRLRHAGARALEAAAALATALILAWTGEAALGLAAMLLAALLCADGAHALRRARRSGVGAKSEAQVRRALEPLKRDGGRVRHALDWPGRGDLDQVVRAPSGVVFMVETKTLRYKRTHLVRATAAARWLGRRRYPSGVRPVICVARARRVERVDGDVVVLSLDRLVPALRRAAGIRS